MKNSRSLHSIWRASLLLLLSLAYQATHATEWVPAPTPITVVSTGNAGSYASMTTVNGNPAIAYQLTGPDNDLVYVRANDALGNTWGTPVVVQSTGSVGRFPQLLVVNGNPAIAYRNATGAGLSYIRATDANGSTWGTPVVIGGATVASVSMALVAGRPAIAYQDNFLSLNYVQANDGDGASWGTPQVLDSSSPNGTGGSASLAVVNGNPAIGYQNQEGTGSQKYIRALDPTGATWGAAVVVDAAGAFLTGAEGDLAEVNGRPAMTYQRDNFLYYVRASDANGATWGTPQNLAPTARYTSLKVISGFPAISYLKYDTGDLRYIRASNADGTAWNPIVEVDNAVNDVGRYSQLEVIAGNAAIAYRDETAGDLKYVRAPNPVVVSYTVTASAGANGALVCTSPVNGGSTTTCTATPNPGYRTASISGCGGTATGVGVNNYTTGLISANCTVTATFGLITVIINELDSDSPGTDTAEFIELYDGGVGNTPLDALALVFYNGSGDVSYAAFDLDGRSTRPNGYFVLCGDAANTLNCDLDVTPNTDLIQNGQDAVALYRADATAFPLNTAVTTTNLVDALVYDTNDADDPGLLVLLNAAQPQVNEAATDAALNSNQRCPNGSGGARNTTTYLQAAPTPGASNACAPPGVILTQSGGTTNVTEGGATDTYTLALSSPPAANVSIAINPGAQVTVGSSPVVFTTVNWATAQTVTVTAVDDLILEGAHTGTISHTVSSSDLSYNGLSVPNVVVNITDNEVDPCSAVSFPYTLPDTAPATLITAITCANANGVSADTINLNGQTVTLTASFADYDGATGLPRVDTSITLRNGTITRSGSNQFRLLQVGAAGNLMVRDMSLTNGGGATYPGMGGNLNANTGSVLTLINTVVSAATVGNSFNAGGIFASGTFTMANCTVSGNTAGRGAGLALQNGPALITNSVISGNVATSILGGGAMYIVGLDVAIINSTITGNYATASGATRPGGILSDVSGANLTVQNSILWGNSNGNATDPQIVNDSSFGSNTVSNSIVQGGQFGGLNAAPLFTTPLTPSATPSTAGNFRLLDASPGIDAGANANVPADTLDVDGDTNLTEDARDLAGNARRFNDTGVVDTGAGTAPIVDLGAYEKQTNSPVDPCAAITFPYTLPDNAPATLITAIECANANGTADVINLNGQTVTLTDSFGNFSGATGLPQVTTAMTVRNGTVTRSGSNEFRFFNVSSVGNLTLRDMTLTNGGGTTYGSNGGSIISQGISSTLAVVNTTISGSRIDSLFNGSAIYSNATFTIVNSRVVGSGFGRGAVASGNGPVLIQNTLIAGNSGPATVNGAGGVYLANVASATVVNSTIVGNYTDSTPATQSGGIFANAGTVNLTIRNSVIWGNRNNGNTAPQVVNVTAGTNTVTNSLIEGGIFGALNSDPLFVSPIAASATPSTAGNFQLGDSSPAIDAGANANVPADTFDVDGDTNLTEDARDLAGNSRRFDDTGVVDTGAGTAPIVDLGAFEKQTNSPVDPCAAITFPYTLAGNTPAELTLAIECANANGPSADTIDLNGQMVTLTAAYADYTGATGLPQIITTMTLRNGTISRSGGNQFRLLSVGVSGNLTLNQVAASNGYGLAPGSMGGGGAIYNLGALNIVGGQFNNNYSALDGGAIHNDGGAVTARYTVFSGNSVNTSLGGVGGGLANSFGVVTLSNVLISGNLGVQGAGIYNNNGGTLTLNNSTIAGNSTNDQGGGLRNENTAASVILNNTIISGNESSLFPATSDLGGSITNNFSLVGGSPSFVAPLDASANAPTTGGNYRLGDGSAAIDAGDNSLVPGIISTDLDGSPRYYDDTGIADTGSGSAPIVDIGAYEKQTNSLPVFPMDVDYCNLQSPTSFTAAAGSTSPVIYGRVFEDDNGVATSSPGAHPSIVAQVGHGPLGSDPRGENPAWQWFATTFNVQIGNDDEYQGTFVVPFAPASTQRSYTYRFSVDNGANYTYCDSDGNGTNGGLGFSTASLGTLTINPGGQPAISVNDVTQNEGNSGTTALGFTVSLNGPSLSAVSFDIATADNTATVVSGDYVANSSAAVVIPAGQTSASFTVLVNGDTAPEAIETFFVNLSNIVNATPADAQGQGTIVNDDDICVLFPFPYMLTGNTPDELIQAVTCANANGTADVIDLNGQTISFTTPAEPATALPQISTNITIRNGSITRTGGTNFRHFFVASTGALTLRNTTLTNGSSAGGTADGGSIYNTGVLLIDNSTLAQNTGLFGGAIFNSSASTATITNSLISGNLANSTGGGIRNRGTLNLINTTVAGNFASVTGGGIANAGTYTTVLSNSIVYGNEAPTSNNVDAAVSGSNNSLVGVDPLFVGPLDASATAPTTGGDYRLGNLSTAIDAGDNTLLPGAVTLDLDGNPRRYNDTNVPDSGVGPAPIVDIGAYERQTNSVLPEADLGITKTNGSTTSVPGGGTIYTIVASNAGPGDVSGASVTDTFPASLSCTWICVGAGGGTCTAAGAGNINDTVNLPSGGSVTYTASCAISPSALGSLANTATVASGVIDPVPDNNSATDTDTLVPSANLAITKTNGTTSSTPGGSTTYTITASNSGLSDASGATVADTFPASLTCAWTCVGAGGGTCTASGAGNINDAVNLPSGGSVTYTASCAINAGATGTLSNTATVTSLANDPNPGNNSATDSDTLSPQADVAITKTDGQTNVNAGSNTVYTIVASNAGPSNAPAATVADSFPAFCVSPSWTCVGAGGGSCAANGSGNLNQSVNLPVGGTVSFSATCPINGTASGTLNNTATVTAGVTDVNGGNNSATDTSTIVAAPVLSINSVGLTEGDSGSTNLVFEVTRTTTATAFSVNYATADGSASAGSDYTTSTGTLNFTAGGAAMQTINVPVTGDNRVEGSESFTLTLSNPTGTAQIGTATGTGTITDNDSATVAFNPTTVSQSEGTSPMAFTATLSNPVQSGVTLTVNSAIGSATGADFTAISGGTLSFPANSTAAQTVNVVIANDALDEDDESFSLTLSGLTATGNVSLGTATASGTILDDDATPTLTITSPSQNEGNAGTSTMDFIVSLSTVSGRDVSFTRATANGTATVANNDYVAIASGNLSIPAGQSSVSIPVTINGDTTFEGNESFSLNLTGIVNATPSTLSGTGTILEDDQQPTTTTITADLPDPSVVGQPYPVAVTVTAQTLSPSGSVIISDGSASCGPVTLSAGTAPSSTASCNLTSTSAGAKTLTASYTAATSAFGNSSGTTSHQVNPAATTISVSGPARSRINQATSFSFALSVNSPGAGTPTGTVTLSSGAASCTATLPATSCSLSFSTLGSRTVSASYAGNANYAGSASSGAGNAQTLVYALSDLAVTKSDGVGTYSPGDLLVYSVTVRNLGPDVAANIRVTDSIPLGLTDVVWSCDASGGVLCPQSGGSGNLDVLVSSFPVGGLLNFSFYGNADGSPAQIANTATVVLPVDTTVEDPSVGNNSATDIDLLDRLFQNGFESASVNAASGSFRVPGVALRSALDELAIRVYSLDDAQGEALRIYARVIDDSVQYALATRDAQGRLRLAAWRPIAGDPTLSWSARQVPGGWLLQGADLR